MGRVSCTTDMLELGVRRVGFLAGSFDPPHDAHLRLMESPLIDGHVEHIMVCAHSCNPEKIDRLTDISHRIEMLGALIATSEYAEKISICDPRAMHGIENLTFQQSVRQLVELGVEVWVVRGQDAIHDGYAQELRGLPHIVVPRQGYENQPERVLTGSCVITRPIGNNSSTAVRAQLAKGLSHPVAAVDRYIREQKLYTNRA